MWSIAVSWIFTYFRHGHKIILLKGNEQEDSWYQVMTIKIFPPLLRPDVDDRNEAIYNRICAKLNLDPKVRDNDTYMQLMNYNQICYMEVRGLSPRLIEKWVWSTYLCNVCVTRKRCTGRVDLLVLHQILFQTCSLTLWEEGRSRSIIGDPLLEWQAHNCRVVLSSRLGNSW